jgi:hypothetical protein
MERRLRVSRLKSVDLPTLGRPTIATSGNLELPAGPGTTDLRNFVKTVSNPVPSHKIRLIRRDLRKERLPSAYSETSAAVPRRHHAKVFFLKKKTPCTPLEKVH